MRYVVISRPKFDETTNYLYTWASKIITSLKRLNFRVIDLKDKKANKKNIENALIKKNPSLVIFNGHGSPTEICGDNNEVLINLENKKHLKSKIVYSISCSSARELGKKVADENTSFAGYEEEFIFLIDKNKACTPEKDEIAKPFMDCSNQFSISLLKGKTTGEAYEDTKRKYNEWICYFAAKEYLPEASSIISCLIWNRDSFILHGNKEKRILQ